MYCYSTRLPWSLEPNELARLTSSELRSGRELLDLTSSNPTACFAEYPHALIRDAFAAIADFPYEPTPFGMPASRWQIVEYYARRNISVDIERIMLTASTSEAYGTLFKLLCNPSDQVLVPSPSYPLFEYLAALESVCLQQYRLRYDGAWHIDLADLRSRITRKTKAIIIVNPNNPTGTFLTIEERDVLVQLASEYQVPLICDEVFLDYDILPRRNISKTLIDCDSVLSFSLNGLSKAAGMPQLKLAWIVINGPPRERATARERLEVIIDTYLSVATPVQQALPSLLRAGEGFQQTIRARLAENLAQIDALLHQTAAHRLYMDGGWSAILQVPRTRTEQEWIAGLLQDRQVIVQPGYYFDLPSEAYLVVSLLTPPATLREGITRLRSHLLPFGCLTPA